MEYLYTYNDFACKVFNYLKNTILIDFTSMELEFNYDPMIKNKFAGNRFNKIVLYMGVYMTDENFHNLLYMKNQIIYSLFHEAFHQIEFTDSNKYDTDKKYRMNVERNVDYSVMHYINDHNMELQRYFNMIVYEYDINTLSNTYDRGGIILNRDYIDMKYFNKLINKFIYIPNLEVYRLFIKYEKVVIHFVLNNETVVDQYTIRDNYVLDFDKMNDIIRKYMYNGYEQRLYKGTKLEKKNEVIFSIFLNNNLIQFMERN